MVKDRKEIASLNWGCKMAEQENNGNINRQLKYVS